MKIYLDIDGVLANWSSAAKKALGVDWQEIGPELADKIEISGLNPMLENIMAERNFWENMEPFSWASDLLEICQDYDIPVYFLTRARKEAGSFSGKLAWIKKYFPNMVGNAVIISAKDKSVCGSSGDILIDDYESCSENWVSNGGIFYHWREIEEGNPNIEFELEKVRDMLDAVTDSEDIWDDR